MQQKEEAFLLGEVFHLLLRKVFFPVKRLTALPIVAEWSDYLANPGRSLLKVPKSKIRQLRIDFGILPKLVSEFVRVHHVETSECLRAEQGQLAEKEFGLLGKHCFLI